MKFSVLTVSSISSCYFFPPSLLSVTLHVVPFVVEKSSNTKVSPDTISQVATVLESLGYSKNEYQGAIETALTQLDKYSEEELLKEVLKILSVF